MSEKEKQNKSKDNKEVSKQSRKKKKFDFKEVMKTLEELKSEAVETLEDEVKSRVYEWYAIRCISGRERKVRNYLLAELERLGYKEYVNDIVIPYVKSYRNIKGKRQLYEKSLMPGYLLYNGLVNADIVQIVRSYSDSLGFVGATNNKLPSPMNDEEVNRILSAVYADVDVSVSDSMSFVPGEVVRIIDGPFEGWIGKVAEVDTKRKRLKVITEIFGRETTVDLAYSQAQKIKS